MGKTLSDKVWDNHVVRTAAGEPDLLYIDLHLVHEVTSPQAFDGLRLAGRPVRRTDLTLATEDHNTPTLNILAPIADPVSKVQVDVEQVRFPGRCTDDVVVPYLVTQGFTHRASIAAAVLCMLLFESTTCIS